MRELHRLYRLAVDLKPNLPDRRLMDLLPKTWGKIITSGAVDGLGSGMANYDQLERLYMEGAENGIEPNFREFKGLLCNQIRNQLIERNKDFDLKTYTKLCGLLDQYYNRDDTRLKQECIDFNDEPAEFLTFSSGFLPIDEAVRADDVPGVTNGILTLLGITGTGKSKLALAFTSMWDYGPAFMLDPENGKARTQSRIKKLNKVHHGKKALIGKYTSDEVYDICVNVNDPTLLLVVDSMHAIAGDGDTPESRGMYRDWYEMFNALLLGNYVKLVVNTTQVKRNDDGKNINSAAGSRNIENYSSMLLFAEKGDALPGPKNTAYHEVTLYGNKNRDGHSKPVKFVFDYRNNAYVDMLENYLDEDLPV